jgi:hypothetical protein
VRLGGNFRSLLRAYAEAAASELGRHSYMVACWCWEAEVAAILSAADLGIPSSNLPPAVVLELWLGPKQELSLRPVHGEVARAAALAGVAGAAVREGCGEGKVVVLAP